MKRDRLKEISKSIAKENEIKYKRERTTERYRGWAKKNEIKKIKVNGR